MEQTNRQPYQGVGNIIKFNWHFYVIAALLLLIVALAKPFIPTAFCLLADVVMVSVLLSTLLSLAVSFYVYDCSNLYTFDWLDLPRMLPNAQIVNIHAGFDETSRAIAQKYPQASLTVLDFYDEAQHTEISIKRARNAYPPYPNTVGISTTQVPLKPNATDYILVLLSAHEIRNREERIVFLGALQQSLKLNGKIIVVEHLRDIPNFIAYNIGFLHFLSYNEWRRTFLSAGLCVEKVSHITPFITVFTLQTNGATR